MNAKIKGLIKLNRWLIALMIVICFGYVAGKDRAMRDNARDAAALNKRTS